MASALCQDNLQEIFKNSGKFAWASTFMEIQMLPIHQIVMLFGLATIAALSPGNCTTLMQINRNGMDKEM
jgi:hypothetical protein